MTRFNKSVLVLLSNSSTAKNQIILLTQFSVFKFIYVVMLPCETIQYLIATLTSGFKHQSKYLG